MSGGLFLRKKIHFIIHYCATKNYYQESDYSVAKIWYRRQPNDLVPSLVSLLEAIPIQSCRHTQ